MLYEEIKKECQLQKKDCPIRSMKKLGEKDWMVKLLSALNSKHEFFTQRSDGGRSLSVGIDKFDSLISTK